VLDRERLASLTPLRSLAGRNISKATVRVYRVDDVEVAVKDYAPRPFLIRQSVGRFLIRREARAYAAAAGVSGIPAFLGRVGPFALATRWVDATPLSALSGSSVDASVFDRAARILEALHARGIALTDLHHRDVLVSRDGAVHLVDLATAVCAGPGAGALARAVFRRARDADRIALARMRARFTGGDERAAVLGAAGPRAAALHTWGRRIKRVWDRIRRRDAA
jgi:hypothetical protein